MSQGDRYLELAARTGKQKLDASYRAAFYLLSQNQEITDIARKHVSTDGIDFAAIKRAVRGFDEISRQVVDIAHNLFSWSSNCKVSPFDISRLGYPYMEQVCNAMFIAGDQYEIILAVNQADQVVLTLDQSNYEQTKQIHRQMDTIYARMLEIQGETDMEMER